MILRGASAAALALLLVLGLAACEPCAGLSSCGGDPSVSYRGALDVRHPDIPKAGLRVVFRPSGGVPVEGDSVVALTDTAGVFTLRADARGEGTLRGDLSVVLPGEFGTLLLGQVELATSDLRGDVRFLSTWKVDPYLAYIGAVFDRRTDRGVPGVTVEFRRTGGIRIRPEQFTTVTNTAGLFGFSPVPLGRGKVKGELTIRAPGLRARTDTIEVSTFDTDEARLKPPALGRYGVGPIINYIGRLLWVDSDEGARDVRIVFRRTGGVQTEQDSLVTTSNADGYFGITLAPLDYGEVVGDLVVRPAPPGRETTYPIRMRTLDDDRVLGNAPPLGDFRVPR